jgi:hypothetical protein
MKRLNKTKKQRQKRFRKQRSRRHGRRHTRRQKGGGLPVPAGALVGVSTGGEFGVPTLMRKEQYEKEKENGSLED